MTSSNIVMVITTTTIITTVYALQEKSPLASTFFGR
jgi:hypothetical protein